MNKLILDCNLVISRAPKTQRYEKVHSRRLSDGILDAFMFSIPLGLETWRFRTELTNIHGVHCVQNKWKCCHRMLDNYPLDCQYDVCNQDETKQPRGQITSGKYARARRQRVINRWYLVDSQHHRCLKIHRIKLIPASISILKHYVMITRHASAVNHHNIEKHTALSKNNRHQDYHIDHTRIEIRFRTPPNKKRKAQTNHTGVFSNRHCEDKQKRNWLASSGNVDLFRKMVRISSSPRRAGKTAGVSKKKPDARSLARIG